MLSVVHPSEVEAMANFGTVWVTQGFVVGLGMATFFVSSSQGKEQPFNHSDIRID